MNKPLNLITGGAGCIGSELAAALIARGERVRVLDNLSTGRIDHLKSISNHPNFEFLRGNVLDLADLTHAMMRVDMVWHLTAKVDIKFLGTYDFDADYDQNLQATWNVLRIMRLHQVKRIAFSSSAAVYGEADVIVEDMPLNPVSMYGATKLACEKMITALALRTDMQAWIFRYCSIVSRKARTAGNMVIPDLIHKLQANPARLEILGDGRQTKPSLLVDDCVAAMLHVVGKDKSQASVHNIGNRDTISVDRQAQLICEAMGVWPEITHTREGGGWPGDVHSFQMDVSKLARLGWTSPRTSEEACKIAIKGILESGE